jgi:alkanesulfonate monooxygenase SsuD/methylene tetrahydromethanopterin reductase-like flavin-dependent oxidoreductase (luciferase family)
MPPPGALAAVALATERVRLGPLVVSMARRRPWKVAREAVTLDHLCGGRLILGVGAGFEDSGFTRFGESADPKSKAERLDEGLAILTGLFSGEPFSFHGRQYTLREMVFRPRPVNGHIPIWVAANKGPAVAGPVRRAARHDGILGGIRRDNLAALRALIDAQRPAGAPLDVVVSVFDPGQPLPSARDVAAWEEAGATWLRYEVGPLGDTVDTVGYARELITNGPPRSRA